MSSCGSWCHCGKAVWFLFYGAKICFWSSVPLVLAYIDCVNWAEHQSSFALTMTKLKLFNQYAQAFSHICTSKHVILTLPELDLSDYLNLIPLLYAVNSLYVWSTDCCCIWTAWEESRRSIMSCFVYLHSDTRLLLL